MHPIKPRFVASMGAVEKCILSVVEETICGPVAMAIMELDFSERNIGISLMNDSTPEYASLVTASG